MRENWPDLARIQGFRRSVHGSSGATGGAALSPDPEQRYLYISDLTNNHMWFLNRADSKVVGTLGQMGENAGLFLILPMIATDLRGTIHTGEVLAGIGCSASWRPAGRAERFCCRPGACLN